MAKAPVTENPAAADQPVPTGVTLTLPSGKVASIRRGKGRDMRAAARVCSPTTDATGYSFAMVAQLATIDGQVIIAEDLDEMDLEDVNALLVAVLGNSPAPTMPSP